MKIEWNAMKQANIPNILRAIANHIEELSRREYNLSVIEIRIPVDRERGIANE